MMWRDQLAEAEDALSQHKARDSFLKAYGALEICYSMAARQRGMNHQANADDKLVDVIKFLHDKKHITEEQFSVSDYLRRARNVVVHRYGFEPSFKEAELTIHRVRQLCTRFGTTVSDVMGKPVLTVRPDQAVGELIEYIVRRGISQFPVVEGGRVVGTVLESHVLQAWEKGEGILDLTTPIRDIMDETLLPSVAPNALLDEVRKRFQEGSSPAFLILNKGMPIGIITKHDLLSHLEI